MDGAQQVLVSSVLDGNASILCTEPNRKMRNYTNVPMDTEGNISLGDFAADYIGPNNKCAPFPIWWNTVHIAEECVGTVVSEEKGNNVESTVPLTDTTAALEKAIHAWVDALGRVQLTRHSSE